MSSETQTHLTSIAKRLEATGFKKTWIAKAVIELVQSYLWHENPGNNITDALKRANTGVTSALPPKDAGIWISTPPANDAVFTPQKTGIWISTPPANDAVFTPQKTGTNG